MLKNKTARQRSREIKDWLKAHDEVAAWLKDRPLNTKKSFVGNLLLFSEVTRISPEEWRRLDKFKARDLAWQVVEPMRANNSSKALAMMAALKSWYRNLNGEQMPFDSGRGGKHNIHKVLKKATYEHIPNKAEAYRIIDMAGNLRDKAIMTTLFQSGVRRNVIGKLTYGTVKDQLSKDLITLKITWDLDVKLRGADIPFYYTCLNGEAVETLRLYCDLAHKNSKPDTPLFYSRKRKKAIDAGWTLRMVKKCIARAGFDPKTMWLHSFRKAFRKIVRQVDIDDDDKEQLMGHVIKGSRQAYYDRHEEELIRAAYQKCNFTREVPRSEVTKLRTQLESEQSLRLGLEKRIELLEEFIKKAVKPS